jgi:translation initiation factor IF-1
MPKNTKGGNKAKKSKNKRAVRPILRKSTVPGSQYAIVVSNLGNGRCNLQLRNEQGNLEEIQGVLRGAVRNLRFFRDDIVLVGAREYKSVDGKVTVDVMHKYFPDHIEELKYKGELDDLFPDDKNDIIFSKRANNNAEDEESEEDEENEENKEGDDNDDTNIKADDVTKIDTINEDSTDSEHKSDTENEEILNGRPKMTISQQKKLNELVLSGKKKQSKSFIHTQQDLKSRIIKEFTSNDIDNL